VANGSVGRPESNWQRMVQPRHSGTPVSGDQRKLPFGERPDGNDGWDRGDRQEPPGDSLWSVMSAVEDQSVFQGFVANTATSGQSTRRGIPIAAITVSAMSEA